MYVLTNVLSNCLPILRLRLDEALFRFKVKPLALEASFQFAPSLTTDFVLKSKISDRTDTQPGQFYKCLSRHYSYLIFFALCDSFGLFSFPVQQPPADITSTNRRSTKQTQGKATSPRSIIPTRTQLNHRPNACVYPTHITNRK